jgi:hypothetical protein
MVRRCYRAGLETCMRMARSWAIVVRVLLPGVAWTEEGLLRAGESEGTLRPEAFASVGLGVDNAR